MCLAGLAAGASLAPDGEGFVRDWLVSGPWPSYQVGDRGQGLDTDFLKTEGTALPFPGKAEAAEFVADWGVLVAGVGSVNEWGFKTNTAFDAKWTPIHSDKGVIRLSGRFTPIDDYFVAYAACYVHSPREMPARIAVGSDDDHKVYLDQNLVGRAESSQDILPGQFKYDVVLPKGVSRLLFKLQDRTGGCGFCVQLTDRGGMPLEGVSISLDPRGTRTTLAAWLERERSPERLGKRLAAARERIGRAKAELPKAIARRAELSNECARGAADLADAYAWREARYAEEHAAAAARGRASVAEPFAPRALRSALCLNGRWESSVDGGRTWGGTYIPSGQLSDFFYPWRYPVKADGSPIPGFERDADEVHHAPAATFRTTVAWDGESDLVLRCDAILGGHTEFRVNGSVCGAWNGDRGVARILLSGLKKGENILEITYDRSRGDLSDGIRGDIFLETLPRVRVDDVWVRTSWRRSELRVDAELDNRTGADVAAQVESYVVRDGKVRFRLPAKSVVIPAGGTAETEALDAWADPETWGIGGRFGEPNLYTLVTDVRVDGVVVDRHEVEFGFREFWICHTDFFLNGRRIILQGDVGHLRINDKRRRDVVWPLYRADGINIVRVHDSDQWSVTAVRDADRMGMAIYAQMYPKLSERGAKHSSDDFTPFETWTATRAHRENLAAYKRWWRDFRNHPSVLIWSTDNEILTQAWDFESKAAFNVRNDHVGALYADYMESLDKDLVTTRDGDVGTWNHKARWFQDPPCDTANYHYPNYDNAVCAVNWQPKYEYRPIIFGEALYCSYFQGRWVGGLPKLVGEKAKQVEKCVGLYTALGIPCAVYMGLGLDGFTMLDDTGEGNPWGLKACDIARFKKDGTPPPVRWHGRYPWLRIDWPAYSGEGERNPADFVPCDNWGTVNVYQEGVPSHVRNAVNDAYRKALLPQPPVDAGRFAEAIVVVGPYSDVWTTTPSGNRLGVRADGDGRAWFRSLVPGTRVFCCGELQKRVELPARGRYVSMPGFVNIPVVEMQ